MNLVGKIHDGQIHGKRINALVRNLLPLLPESGTLLDVGCGDGLLASLLANEKPDLHISGIDVLVRPETKIPVTGFDGITIPFTDKSVDIVMMIDVLHHTDDATVLLREAQRVARKWVLIKDHNRNGILAGPTLRFMDWVGNSYTGVALPYNYLTRQQWTTAFAASQLTTETMIEKLDLYGKPADWWFGRSLHFIARLTP